MKIAYMLTLVILILIVAISGYFIGSLTTFPGRIFTPEYEPTLDIKRLTLREGAVYRDADMAPLLELKVS